MPNPAIANPAAAAAPRAQAMMAAPAAALWVGDLGPEVTARELMDMFNPVAAVASIRLCRDRETGESRGYAYVNFSSTEDAERAMETLNYTPLQGAPCRIMWANRDKETRANPKCNIVLKGLPPNVGPKDVHDSASMYGNVISCKVPYNREKGEFVGHGFVQFEKEEEAAAAVEDYDESVFEGVTIKAEMFRSRERRINEARWTNVYVKQYPRSYTEEQIRALLAPMGEITSLFIPTDDEGKPRGFCFANFAESADAKRAVNELNGTELANPDHVPATDTAPASGGPARLTLSVSRAMAKADRVRIVAKTAQEKKREFQRSVEGRNLYVKNLDERVDDEALRAFFGKHGVITSARVSRDPATGKSLLYGYVCFSTKTEAEGALASTNKHLLEGKPLYVAMWMPKARRQAHLSQTHPAAMPARMPGAYPGAYPGAFPGMAAYNMRVLPGMGPYNPYAGMRMPGGYPMPMAMGQPMQPPQAPAQPQPRAVAPAQPAAPAAAAAAAPAQPADIADMDPASQRRFVGGRLYPLIQSIDSARAPKLTGMILEGRDITDLLSLIESPEELKTVVAEAQAILDSRNA